MSKSTTPLAQFSRDLVLRNALKLSAVDAGSSFTVDEAITPELVAACRRWLYLECSLLGAEFLEPALSPRSIVVVTDRSFLHHRAARLEAGRARPGRRRLRLEGLTMEKQHSRRAALGALASVPALAILPVAASSPSTTQLSALIEAHRAARAIFSNATEASEAAEPDPDIRVYYLGRELFAIGHSRRETLIDAEEDAILAICEHRCVSIEEIAIEVRHLAGLWTAYSRRTRAARFLRRFCRKGRKSNCLFDDRTAVGRLGGRIDFAESDETGIGIRASRRAVGRDNPQSMSASAGFVAQRLSPKWIAGWLIGATRRPVRLG